MTEKRWQANPNMDFSELLTRIRPMTTGQKAVALFLAVQAEKDEAPTLNEMEADMGIGRSTIERAMPGLRRAGIAVEWQRTPPNPLGEPPAAPRRGGRGKV